MRRRPSFRLSKLALGTLLCGALARAPAVASTPAAPVLVGETCSVAGLLEKLRHGLDSPSAAYRRYLRNLLREAAVTLPAVELRAAFARETHPVLVEQLAAALVARTERGADPSGMQTVTERALREPDPTLRAAVVRALRRTSALENSGDLYERLVRDPAPAVRLEAAQNLVEDNQFVYSGHHGPAADAAVAAAAAATDPQVTAKILGSLSTEAVSSSAAGTLRGLLRSPDTAVREAVATALGGVPAAEATAAREALLTLYRSERDRGVRRAILGAIAQLGFARAIPELRQLREVDPGLTTEVDLWIQTLSLGLPEWSLILREKQRLEQQAAKHGVR
jgi:HEAT repeat protein